jgi:hypothetical protein
MKNGLVSMPLQRSFGTIYWPDYINRSPLTALVPQFLQRIRFDDAGEQAQIPDFGAPFSAPANL